MDTFSALADPTRRHIIEILVNDGELSATDISNKFSVSKPAISQHLKILRDTHLVTVEKRAQQRMYHINPLAIDEIDSWFEKLKKKWNERFDRLEALLESEQKRGGGK